MLYIFEAKYERRTGSLLLKDNSGEFYSCDINRIINLLERSESFVISNKRMSLELINKNNKLTVHLNLIEEDFEKAMSFSELLQNFELDELLLSYKRKEEALAKMDENLCKIGSTINQDNKDLSKAVKDFEKLDKEMCQYNHDFYIKNSMNTTQDAYIRDVLGYEAVEY